MGCASEESNRIKRDSAFSECRVDFGIVVSDLDESAAFYTDALGLTEVGGFSVPATMGGDSGLSDYKPFRVRVFKIDGLANATQVKLMEFPAENPKPIDNEYIHSSLGVSYLTLYVNDMDQAVARARRAGVEPVAKGPIDLPEGFPDGIYLALVRDPDGNLIEFVGPKASE
jgi:catechol 2,3-dioxygenase-like lactoylglutathione lyase family enzyme